MSSESLVRAHRGRTVDGYVLVADNESVWLRREYF